MPLDAEFAVDPAYLTADANRWDDISAAITEAVNLAHDETEVPLYTMDGLSVALGLKNAYDVEQDATVSYLLEGKQYLATIGQTLRDTRDTYLASDQYAAWLAARAAKVP